MSKLSREQKYLVLFVLLAVYLSVAESFIPKPFPWIKIGLSNIVTIVALKKFGASMAKKVVILRILIQSIALGTLFSVGFIISICAGIVGVMVLTNLYKLHLFSTVAISSISAFCHNLTQMIVVYFLLFRNIPLWSKSIFLFSIIFLGLGIISGVITGIIAEKIYIRHSSINSLKAR